MVPVPIGNERDVAQNQEYIKNEWKSELHGNVLKRRMSEGIKVN